MSTGKPIRNLVGLARRGVRAAKVFFVRWFLPLPAVDKLEEHDRWSFDEDEREEPVSSAAGEATTDASIPVVPTIAPAAAPEVRAPEGADDRQGRQLNMPNPFA
ncbi:MAG: hypothetical protein ACR2IE_05845 [Candidatus Sumerlaeaceae bacterium]